MNVALYIAFCNLFWFIFPMHTRLNKFLIVFVFFRMEILGYGRMCGLSDIRITWNDNKSNKRWLRSANQAKSCQNLPKKQAAATKCYSLNTR